MYTGPYLAGGEGSCPPGNHGEKVPFLRAGAHQQGALLNLGLPPPPPQQLWAAYGHGIM